MRTFIYSYEAELLSFINDLIPEVKEMIYTSNESMFPSISSVKKFPCVYYTRSDTDTWSLPRIYKFSDVSFVDGDYSLMRSQIAVIEQHYTMRVYVENVAKALSFSSLVKHKFSNYIDVPWEFTKTYLYNRVTTDKRHRVGQYLLGIHVGEDRNPSDKIGSQRYVDVNWTCQLFQWWTERDEDEGLVEEVHFYNGEKDVLMVDGELDDTKVFSIIPKSVFVPPTPTKVWQSFSFAVSTSRGEKFDWSDLDTFGTEYRDLKVNQTSYTLDDKPILYNFNNEYVSFTASVKLYIEPIDTATWENTFREVCLDRCKTISNAGMTVVKSVSLGKQFDWNTNAFSLLNVRYFYVNNQRVNDITQPYHLDFDVDSQLRVYVDYYTEPNVDTTQSTIGYLSTVVDGCITDRPSVSGSFSKQLVVGKRFDWRGTELNDYVVPYFVLNYATTDKTTPYSIVATTENIYVDLSVRIVKKDGMSSFADLSTLVNTLWNSCVSNNE